MTKRIGNLWEQIIEMDNLRLALKKARKGKIWRNVVRRIDKDQDKYLEQIRESLINQTFATADYRIKTIHEPKTRQIYILPYYPDRIVQHALMNILAPILDNRMIYASCSCREGKGQHFGSNLSLKFIQRNRYCLQCDVSKFYPSINHDILFGLIKDIIKDAKVLALIENIIRSGGDGINVPIGNYTSQWFGNLYLTPLDRRIKQYYHIRDYIRYCDDFVLFGNDKTRLREIGDELEEYLRDEFKLKLSKKNLFKSSQGLDFLGYRHFPDGKILVRKSTAKRIKRRIISLPERVEAGTINIDKAVGKVASAKGWLSHANTNNFKKSIYFDEIYDKVMEVLKRGSNT